ncbi:MAG: FAD-dependent oxidoreductase [Candidatus Kapabacteria bacterium]|jgi:hypothetical protein|nr:FAD-dependent oxidoreductase [Candidatus Kapabacteria bacterium]
MSTNIAISFLLYKSFFFNVLLLIIVMPLSFTPNYPWQNFHQNVSATASRLYELTNRNPDRTLSDDALARWKAGIAQVQTVLGEAAKNNQSVLPVGASWSLSTVGKTQEYLLGTESLNIITVGLKAQNIEQGNSKYFVLAQCGASVRELNVALAKKNLALPTTGASDGQTIVGAITTGTHGGAINVGIMADYVRGLHIITGSAPNQQFWLEPSQKYVSDNFMQTVVPQATRINDDATFYAALVSFGAFGFIHAMLLEVEDMYSLELHQKIVSWSDVQKCIDGPANLDVIGYNPNPFHFEVIRNPYMPDEVIARAIYKKSGSTPINQDTTSTTSCGPGLDLLHVIGTVMDGMPFTIPHISKALQKIINQQYPPTSDTLYAPMDLFGGSWNITSQKGLSTDIAVDAKSVSRVVEILLSIAEQQPFPGIIALRYVKQSKATFASAQFPTTCTIEMPSVYSKEAENYYDTVWKKLDAEGIPFFLHWGQCNDYALANITKRFGPAAVQSWQNARQRLLPTAQQQAMFASDFLKTCGLAGNNGNTDIA